MRGEQGAMAGETPPPVAKSPRGKLGPCQFLRNQYAETAKSVVMPPRIAKVPLEEEFFRQESKELIELEARPTSECKDFLHQRHFAAVCLLVKLLATGSAQRLRLHH